MAYSPIEEGEIVDFVLDGDHSFTNQEEDNYEHVSMDIESDSDNCNTSKTQGEVVTKTSVPNNMSIDFDDADSLRQLLLSQVSTRKKTVPIERQEQLVSCSKESPAASKPDEVLKDTEAVDFKREEPEPTTIEYNLNLRGAKSHSRCFNKELTSLQKKFQALQEKVETTTRRKRRLENSIRECDSFLNTYQKQSFELLTALFKSSLTAASSHISVLREVEAYQSACEQALENKREAKPDMVTRGTQTIQPKPKVSVVLPQPPPPQPSNKKIVGEKVLKKSKNGAPKLAASTQPVLRQTENIQCSAVPNGFVKQVGLAKVFGQDCAKQRFFKIFSNLYLPTTPQKVLGIAVEKVLKTAKTVETLKIVESSNSLSAVKPSVKRKRKRALVTAEDLGKNCQFPMLSFSSFKLDNSFPFMLLKHPAFANKIDPAKPLCPFQLHGRCADRNCPWQHDSDYRLSDQEIVVFFLQKCPFLCNGVEQGSFARKLLEQHSVEDAVRYLASRAEKVANKQ